MPIAPAEAGNGAEVHWAERLRERSRELGLSDAQVARRLGLAQTRYSNYTNRAREPDLALFARICRALGTSPDAMLGFEQAADAGTPDGMLVARGLSALQALSGRDLFLAVAVLESILKTSREDA